MKQMSKWLHAIHSHCTSTKTADNPAGEGFTIDEAVRRFGTPVSRSTPRNILRLAQVDGHFISVRRRTGRGTKGRWFVAVYYAVGQTPPLKPEPVPKKPVGPSMFDGLTRASSIFDLASKTK